MKTKLIKTFFLFFTLNSFCQGITFIKDEILNNYKESGFLRTNFIPVGEIDAKYDKQGFWKDYIKINDYTYVSTYVSNEEKPLLITGNFLIYEEGNYSNSEKIGKWLHFTIEDNTFKKILQKEDNYIDGFLDGEFKYFFPNGNIALAGNRDRKNNETTIKTYYLDGEIFGTGSYKNNLINGTHTFFYRDGTIMQKIKYDMGKKNGVEQFYHKNGQLWAEQIFKNDLLLNVKCNYTKNGKLRDKGTMKDGNGTVKLYTEEGKLYKIITYKKGLKISEKKL